MKKADQQANNLLTNPTLQQSDNLPTNLPTDEPLHYPTNQPGYQWTKWL